MGWRGRVIHTKLGRLWQRLGQKKNSRVLTRNELFESVLCRPDLVDTVRSALGQAGWFNPEENVPSGSGPSGLHYGRNEHFPSLSQQVFFWNMKRLLQVRAVTTTRLKVSFFQILKIKTHRTFFGQFCS